MRAYFCGAIAGGRDHLPIYRHIVEYLQSRGHEVLTDHVARPEVLKEESAFTAREVYDRDLAWMRQSAVMIAEVSTPSLGVGYEIACGLHVGMPILCLHREGLLVSKMITGNPDLNLHVHAYRDPDELIRHIDAFLKTKGRLAR